MAAAYAVKNETDRILDQAKDKGLIAGYKRHSTFYVLNTADGYLPLSTREAAAFALGLRAGGLAQAPRRQRWER